MYSIAQGRLPRGRSIADLAWIALFFLLRPGEYCAGGTDTVSTPFTLCDIQFFVGTQTTQATTSSPSTCNVATFVGLLFTTHKNDVKGESIEHGAIGYPCACVVAAIRRRVAHLQQHSAAPNTHFVVLFKRNKWSTIRSAEITAALLAETTIIGPQVWFLPDEVSARLMRAGGAMALPMARVETDNIRLVGRWRSEAMLHYLHTTAQMFTGGLVARMVQHRDYTLIPPAQRD